MEFFHNILTWLSGNSSSLSDAQKREVLNMLTSMQERLQETSRAYVRGQTYDLSERIRDNSAKLASDQENIKQDLAVKNAVLTTEINFLKKSLRDESSSTKAQMENFTKEYDEQIKNLKEVIYSLSSQNKVDEKKEEDKTSKIDINALTDSLQNLMRGMTRGNDFYSNVNFSPNGQFHLPPSNVNPSNPSYFGLSNPPQNLGPGPTFSHPPNLFRPNHPYSPNSPSPQNPSNFQPAGPWPNFQPNFGPPNFGPRHKFEGPNFRPNLPHGAPPNFRAYPQCTSQEISHARKNAEHFTRATSNQETGYRHTNGRRGRNIHKQFLNKRNAYNKTCDKESGYTRNEQVTERNTSRQNNFSKAAQGKTSRKTDGNDSDSSTTSGFSTASSNSIKQPKHFNSKEKITLSAENVKLRSDNLRNRSDGNESDIISQASSGHKNKSKTTNSSEERTRRKFKNFIDQTDGDESDFSTISQASSSHKGKSKTTDLSGEKIKQRSKNSINRTDGDESDFSTISQASSSHKGKSKTRKAASSREDTRFENRRNQIDDDESDFSNISHASSSHKEKHKTLAKTAKSEESKKESRLKKLHRFNKNETRENDDSVKSRPSYSRNKEDGENASLENNIGQKSIKLSQIENSESDSSVEPAIKFSTNKPESEKAKKSKNDRQLKSDSSFTDVVKVNYPSREQALNENKDLNTKFKKLVLCVGKVNDEPISAVASCLAEIYAFEDRYGECHVVRV